MGPISREYSERQRFGILTLVGVAGMIAPISSAIYFPALLEIQNDLNTSESMMDGTIAGFMAAMAIFPLLWGTLADAYGRKGAGSSATLVTGVGTIIDIFPAEKRETLSPSTSDAVLNFYKRRKGKSPCPEVRLYGVVGGIISIITGLSLTGYFLEATISLPATLVAEFLIGFGMTNVFSGTSTYLIDLFPNNSSSIMACNACFRTLAAAIITSFTTKILDTFSYLWAFTIFAFLQIPGILALLVILFSNKLHSPPIDD
ncbi:hypothetical protein L0F63_001497 [Massospora cicadina]|nr:hypothetical protein L0F63_001497 [Massospora cicadina]